MPRALPPLRSVALPLVLATLAAGCEKRGPTGACDAIAGVWRGAALEPDPGSDEDAARLMTDVILQEQWRLTRVVPGAFSRERVGAAGGPVTGDALYIVANARDRCVVDLRVRDTTHRLTLTPRADGGLTSRTEGSWFTAVYRRPR
jgi:hypothetical protein